MNSLQEALDRALDELPYRIVADRVRSKANEAGVRLSDKEIDRFVKHLAAEQDGEFRFRTWRWWDRRELTISLGETDRDQILATFESFLSDGLEGFVQGISEDLASEILATLRTTWPKQLRHESRQVRGFERRLDSRWGAAIERLLMTLIVCRELGELAAATYHGDDDAPEKLVDVLSRLHARACQVTEEIVCLLRSGLADGAMARWRTLHEIAAVGLFLSQNDMALAERYAEHQAVESFRAASEYRRCCEALGYEPISDDDFTAIKESRDQLVERHGKEFATQYGWAAHVLGVPRPTLRDIHRAAGVEHLQAHYRLASHNVHANPTGAFLRLGLLDDVDVLLAGRSDVGLDEPGVSCSISLSQITVAFATLSPNLDLLVGIKIVEMLRDETISLFDQVASEAPLCG